MASVYQDSGALRDAAGEIHAGATDFSKLYNEVFTEVAKRIQGAEASGVAWWGPQASAFVQEFNTKKDIFATAEKNIRAMADNLEDQAAAWDSFENA